MVDSQCHDLVPEALTEQGKDVEQGGGIGSTRTRHDDAIALGDEALVGDDACRLRGERGWVRAGHG
jgi:hypothetical protein